MATARQIPENWPEVAWRKLPVELRVRAVDRIRGIYSESFLEQVRERVERDGLGRWLPVGWHFAQGMSVRNSLRSNHGLTHDQQRTAPILDAELPALPEVYGSDAGYEGNWDDFYVQALEAAAGCRPVSDGAADAAAVCASFEPAAVEHSGWLGRAAHRMAEWFTGF